MPGWGRLPPALRVRLENGIIREAIPCSFCLQRSSLVRLDPRDPFEGLQATAVFEWGDIAAEVLSDDSPARLQKPAQSHQHRISDSPVGLAHAAYLAFRELGKNLASGQRLIFSGQQGRRHGQDDGANRGQPHLRTPEPAERIGWAAPAQAQQQIRCEDG